MGETTSEVVEHALDLQDKKVGDILVTEGAVSEQALEEALQAFREDEVPIGAVLVSEGTVLARAHNMPISLNDLASLATRS